MTAAEKIRAHLEWLLEGYSHDPHHAYDLGLHIAEEWKQLLELEERQVCDVVAAWLAVCFNEGRLPFEFADGIANNMHWIATHRAPPGVLTTDLHTRLSWEVYLAFDGGEYSPMPGFHPVEGVTRPRIADIVRNIERLVEYEPALPPFTALRSATS